MFKEQEMNQSMEKHIQLCGWLWIVLGGLSFLGGMTIFGLLFGLSYLPDIDAEGAAILRIVGGSVGVLLWVLAAPKIIAGIGLLKRMEWARILALILSFISLINIPLGTALGIYSLVILLKEDSIRLFQRQG
jgi:hypothetical protein